MNLNGNEGPTLKKIFTCENCKFLSDASILHNYPYKCYHDEILRNGLTTIKLMTGNIGRDKITPLFCPYLIKQLRKEKLKALERPNCIICGSTLQISQGCYLCDNCGYMKS